MIIMQLPSVGKVIIDSLCTTSMGSFVLSLAAKIRSEPSRMPQQAELCPAARTQQHHPIINIPAFVQIMVWRRPGVKPLSEPMMIILLTYI